MKTAEKTKGKAGGTGGSLAKVDQRELLLKRPIKIKKRGKKELAEGDSPQGEERERKVVLSSKRIKKEDVKEKIMEIRKRRKNYNRSEDSDEGGSDFDEDNLPVMPNRFGGLWEWEGIRYWHFLSPWLAWSALLGGWKGLFCFFASASQIRACFRSGPSFVTFSIFFFFFWRKRSFLQLFLFVYSCQKGVTQFLFFLEMFS